MNHGLTEEQIAILNSSKEAVAGFLENAIKAVEAACIFKGELNNGDKESYETIVQAFHTAILLTKVHKTFNFGSYKLSILDDERFIFENLNFGKLHAISQIGKGTAAIDKNGNRLNFQEDLNDDEKSFMYFFAIVISGYFQNATTDELCEKLMAHFKSEAIKRQSKEDKTSRKNFEEEALSLLDNIKEKMGIGEPEGLKDVNEFPLEIQKKFCDLADGKIKGNTKDILIEYLQYLITFIKAAENIADGTPFGWSNFFGITNDGEILIVGDFKSRFNAVHYVYGEKSTFGLFSFDGVMPLADGAIYNDKKSEIFTFVFTLALKFVLNDEKINIDKLAESIDYLLKEFEVEPDTVAIEPMYKFNIKKLEVTKNNSNNDEKYNNFKQNIDKKLKKEPQKNDFNKTEALAELDELNKQMRDLISEIEIKRKKPENMNQEEKAFDLMLNCTNPQDLISNAYLIEAIVEVMKDSTRDKTMLYMETAVFSNDKATKVMRLIFNKKNNIIFTYDLKKEEFYIQEEENLKKWKLEDFEDEPVEYKKAGIIRMLLLTIAEKLPFEGFFTGLIAIANLKKK